MTCGEQEKKKALKRPGVSFDFFLETWVVPRPYGRHYLQQSQLGHHNPFWSEFLTWLACFCPWAFLAPLIYQLEKSYSLMHERWLRTLGSLVAIGLALSYAAYQVTLWICVLIQRSFAQPLTIPRPIWSIPKGELYLEQFLFWATVGAAYIIRNLMQLDAQERDKAELLLEKSQLEANLKQAQLETLRLRLNPHFLFNTLQNISILAPDEPKTASQMLPLL